MDIGLLRVIALLQFGNSGKKHEKILGNFNLNV